MSRDEPRPHDATSFRFPFQLSIKVLGTSLRGEGGGVLDPALEVYWALEWHTYKKTS